MSPLRHYPVAATLVAACFFAPALQAQVTVSTGADYSVGHYGETEKTKLLSIPLNLEYALNRWTFKASLPYLHMTGPGTVIPGIGRVKASAAPAVRTETGIGDTTVDTTYIFYQPSSGVLTLDAGGEVKFGTASATKNLGTGKTDYAGHFDAYRTWGKLTGLATIGYRVLTSPAAAPLKNNWYGTVGWSFQAAPASSVGLLYSANQRTSATSGAQEEIIAFGTWKPNDHWNSQLYLMGGLTSASPDIGTGVLLSHTF